MLDKIDLCWQVYIIMKAIGLYHNSITLYGLNADSALLYCGSLNEMYRMVKHDKYGTMFANEFFLILILQKH